MSMGNVMGAAGVAAGAAVESMQVGVGDGNPMAEPEKKLDVEHSVSSLAERVAIIEEELDPEPDWRQKLVDMVDAKFQQYNRPLLMAIIMGTFTVVCFIVLFGILASQKETNTSVSCITSLTLPQYVGSMAEQGRMIDDQKRVVGKDLRAECYDVKTYNTSYYTLQTPEQASKDIKCVDTGSTQTDAKIWHTGYLSFCINQEVKVNQAQAWRKSDWQYSPPGTTANPIPNTGQYMSLLISQEHCYPPAGVFTKIQLCNDLPGRYHVYSVKQGKGIQGEDAIKASSDFSRLTCPDKFQDTAPIPWRVDFHLQYSICTHKSWTSTRSAGEVVGLAMAYQVYIDMVGGVIIISLLTTLGVVEKQMSAIKKHHQQVQGQLRASQGK